MNTYVEDLRKKMSEGKYPKLPQYLLQTLGYLDYPYFMDQKKYQRYKEILLFLGLLTEKGGLTEAGRFYKNEALKRKKFRWRSL